MQWLLSLVQVGFVYGLMGAMGVVGGPIVLWSRAWTRAWMKAYVRIVFTATRLLCGLSVEVRGPVPSGGVIVASKHQSLLDVMLLLHALPEAHFVMKRSLVWAPVFGLYALRIGCIWIVRERRGEAGTMMRRLERGYSGTGQIVIYPQGTRVPPGERRPYRRGAVLAYGSFGLPMVLAATNTGCFWPKRGILRRPGTAVLEFLETIPPQQKQGEVLERMEAVIEEASDRLAEEARESLSRRRGWRA